MAADAEVEVGAGIPMEQERAVGPRKHFDTASAVGEEVREIEAGAGDGQVVDAIAVEVSHIEGDAAEALAWFEAMQAVGEDRRAALGSTGGKKKGGQHWI